VVFTAQQIAAALGGTLVGDPNVAVSTVGKIEEAGPDALAFLANPKYEGYLSMTNAAVVLVNESLPLPQDLRTTVIQVPDAYAAFTTILQRYEEALATSGARTGREDGCYIHPSARVHESAYVGAFAYVAEGAVIGKGTQVMPGCYIGPGVRIGDGCTLHPSVVIYAGCQLYNRVTVHSGTVIGADGFGFAPQADGTYKKVPQIGTVEIEDDVEIGANTTVDRATMGRTVIRRGAKLDNLIQVAHNVEVGEHTVIAAQTGISGSTKIGRGCMIGGQVGMVGHIQIADGTRINAQSGLSKSVTTPGTALNGSPAFEYKAALKSQAVFRNLPDLQARIAQLEETVKALTARLDAGHPPTNS